MSSDDAEENQEGKVKLNSSDIELVFEREDQTVGLRFTHLNIPKDADIVEAYLQFTVDEIVNIDPCQLDIYGELNADPPTFADTPKNVSNRARTRNHVRWVPGNWVDPGKSGPLQQSADISRIIQEIVKQQEYNSNSAITIIIDGTGKRVAEAYDGSVKDAPELCITYNLVCPEIGKIGQPCNDGDPCTVDDIIQADCSCAGVYLDTDNDGICDFEDACPEGNQVGSPCDDGDPCTIDDIIQADCRCMGVLLDADNDGICDRLNECPEGLTIGAPCDDGNPYTEGEVILEDCSCGGGTPVTINACASILASSDDAEEGSTGKVDLTSTDLELVTESDAQTIGLRFTNLYIPPRATIVNASIQFAVDERKNINPCILHIYGEASDNASAFNRQAGNITQRVRTSSHVTWTPSDWTQVGQADTDQKTPDLSEIIQEIVDRSNYQSNGAIAIIIDGSGKRVAESYDGKSELAPKLCVTYEVYDCPVERVNFGDPCDDGDPCTIDDIIQADCRCAGVLQDDDSDGICDRSNECPDGPTPGTPCDDGNPYTEGEVILEDCSCGGGTPVTFNTCVSIIASSDDAEEGSSGKVDLTSSDLELVTESDIQTIGLRFTGLHIPPRATIVNASIQFAVDERKNVNPCMLHIYGEASDNASAFNRQADNITQRVRTTSHVTWTPSDWTQVGQADSDQKTPDLSEIIQEIVDRSNYQSNGAIAIIIDGSGKRVAESYDGQSELAPKLCVTYKVYDCPDERANFGDPCDDGDPCTVDDIVQADCTCAGDYLDSDNDGTCDADDICGEGPEPGTPCDGDPANTGETIQEDCQCGKVSMIDCKVSNTHDSGPGSLRYGIACTGVGDTLRFDENMSGETISLDSVIIFNKDIIIFCNHNSDITVSGLALNKTLQISKGVRVEIIGAGIITSSSTDGGIWNLGTLVLNNVKVLGDASPGAVLINDGILEISNESSISTSPDGFIEIHDN